MATANERGTSQIPKQPFNWPVWDSLEALGSQIPDDFSITQLSSAAKSAYRRFNEQDDAAALARTMRKFDAKLLSYHSSKLAALLRLLEQPTSTERQAIFQKFVLEEPEVDSLLNTVYRPLLEKENLTELSDFLGKNLFLRMQNRQILFKAELTELLQTEKLLVAQGPEMPGLLAILHMSQRNLALSTRIDEEINLDEQPGLQGFAEENRRRIAGQSLSDLYLQLFRLRMNLADTLGLPNFRDLAFLRQERYDDRLTEISTTITWIKNYFVPLAIALRRNRLDSDKISLSSHFYCWQNWLPNTETLPKIDAAPTDLGFLASFLNLVLKGFAPNFLTRLQEKSFVRLQAGGPKTWADCVLLPKADLPCIIGQIDLDSKSLPQLLEVLGLAYAYLCAYNDGSFVLMREPSFELRKIWSNGMLFLAADVLPQLFEEVDEGEHYRDLFLEQSIQRLCFQAMLFEFENEVADLRKADREAMERSWSRVIRRYYPDLAEDSAWLRMQRGAYMYLPQLWFNPFSSVAELQALLVGLSMWDSSRNDRLGTVTAYETLCTLGSSDSVPNLLAQARLLDPWSESCVKRLAYQLAYHLGY